MRHSSSRAGIRLAVCACCAGWVQWAAGAAPYLENRAPLLQQPFLRLPLGCVTARGWLKTQLELQRDGLTGSAETLYADIGQSDWVTGGRKGGEYAWERGPYYAKGLIPLAFLLDDAGLKEKARRWVDQVLQSQRPDGDFGPKARNWWANMIVLHYLRDYYEVTGEPRVLAFLDKYFRFQLQTLPEHTLLQESKWAQARGGDNLEIVIWYYNLQGGEWLFRLARLLVEQTAQWERYYADGTGNGAYPEHIVNAMQGLKAPPLMYLITGKESHRDGFRSATRPDGWLAKKCGRVDAMLSGTEPLTDLSSTQGTELCAIVEQILSCTVALGILGDAEIGDRLETLAYNALPAALAPDIKGLRYYSLPNQPKCTDEPLGFVNNGSKVASICPSPHSGFGCCRSNFHFGWPKFVQHMWMATADRGLAVITYGPNRVTAKAGPDGREVSIEQDTGYPFRSEVTLTVKKADHVSFPLKLRIPGWCASPRASVNGKRCDQVTAGQFLVIERTWESGDVVALDFPMAPKLWHGINRSVAVTRGPLIYSLLIAESPWKSTADFGGGAFHTYEIRPASDWNYALLLTGSGEPRIEAHVAGVVPAQPFRAEDAPVRLTVKAFKTDKDGWGSYREDFPGRAKEPPASPLAVPGQEEDAVLVPYGATQIRVCLFPWASR